MTIQTIDIQNLLQAGLTHQQSGRLQQAEQLYRQILAHEPANADANHLLGILAYQVGKFGAAVKLITRATETDPRQPVFFNNLGNALKADNNKAAAVEAYRRALALKPDYGDALYNLGNGLMALEQPEAAVSAYRRALTVMPGSADCWYNLGNACMALKEYSEAVAAYRQAITLRPDYADAHYNISNVLLKLHRPEEAAASCRKALAVNPAYAEALNNLGKALADLKLLDQAVGSFQKAVAIRPDYAEAWCNLGTAFYRLGRVEAAIEHYNKAFSIDPSFSEAHSALFIALHYLPTVSQEDIFQQAKKWNERHAKPLAAKQKPHENSRDWNRRLRIGYVSPDFRFHAVNRFFEPLLTAHDRDKFGIYLYSNVRSPDDVTRRLQAKADHWLSIVKMSDEEAAERVRADRIDILVDLAKHSTDNRLLLFALKPAPVQATWLGYPCSTGMEAMDYRIVDALTHPVGKTDHLNSEELVRLEHGYFCFEPNTDIPAMTAVPASERGCITFGSFNNLLKIHAEVIAAWSEIMNRVPGSRLIMLGRKLTEESERARFVKLFAAHGIEEERLEMIPFLPYMEYLAMNAKVDIALDPFPYNGHTTTCDTLWMGVPVITLQGEADCSRVGASILTRIGLTELIAGSRQEYIDKAVALAGDIDRLSALRKGMRARLLSSSLCDVRGFARDMEAAYVTMWRKWCDSAA